MSSGRRNVPIVLGESMGRIGVEETEEGGALFCALMILVRRVAFVRAIVRVWYEYIRKMDRCFGHNTHGKNHRRFPRIK